MISKKWRRKLAVLLSVTVVGAAVMTGCGNSSDSSSTAQATETATQGESTTADTEQATGADEEITTESTLQVTADMAGFKDSDAYADWTTGDYIEVAMNGNSVTLSDNASGITVDGQTITINSQGTYVFSGTLEDGQIRVEAKDTEDVRLVLNGVEITCSDGPAIYGIEADKIVISTAAGTTNILNDGSTYTEEEPTACVYSKTDLVLNGEGTLQVQATYNNGIQSKDDLRITSGTYEITSADDGLVGKDKVAIADGTFTINAGGDGIKSTNAEDAELGFVYIEKGTYTITSGTDGIQAETGMLIADGTFEITADGGVANAQESHPGMGGMSMGRMGAGYTPAEDTDDTDSTEESTTGSKGIKAGGYLEMQGGTYTVDASNDALHSNYIIEISGGTYGITAGDDGVHADEQLLLNDGTMTISQSYEGLESADIIINGGTYSVTATDDGINGAGGSMDNATAQSQQQPNAMLSTSTGSLTIHGGEIFVSAVGDGIDVNGDTLMDGGSVIVEGPEDSGNGALDYDGSFVIDGGTFLALGSSGMMQTTSDQSAQNGVTVVYSSTQAAGTTVSITDSQGNVIIEHTPEKTYQSVVFVSSDLQDGTTYNLNSNGTLLTEITLSGVMTTVDDSGNTASAGMGNMQGGGGMRGGGGGRMQQGEVPTDGEMPSGDMPADGQMPSGDMPTDGQMPSGERPTAPGRNANSTTDSTSGQTSSAT